MKTPLGQTAEKRTNGWGRGRASSSSSRWPAPWRLDYGLEPPLGALGNLVETLLPDGRVRTWAQRMTNGPHGALFYNFVHGRLEWLRYKDFWTEDARDVGDAGEVVVGEGIY